MDDISIFLGVINIALISISLKSALILHFGEIRQSKRRVVIAHWTITGLAILSLVVHVAVVGDRPWHLVIAASVILVTLVFSSIRTLAKQPKLNSAKA